jgi:hypothetical protein
LQHVITPAKLKVKLVGLLTFRLLPSNGLHAFVTLPTNVTHPADVCSAFFYAADFLLRFMNASVSSMA